MYTKDPFFAVKEEVEQNFANATTIFQSWSRIYNTVASRNNEELQRTEEELTGMLQNVGTDLDDLEETINIL
ncbi:1143_t:CDS:2 [Paraglomus brasilianum]|uniref:1143_t:CDS:1 n=1 Tax=Paraglomus brasilianum TaxID=144538 RepID=A0A9N9BFZ3_9GLOM|nr:1143_t:CDS:2 [Paraglomus brasilianum]